ncbi:hypothetical protein M758_11G067400 [Ceratodon purpureus]|nr:hypothetical protein M758_11G067400 [Ceratodon purpureus]
MSRNDRLLDTTPQPTGLGAANKLERPFLFLSDLRSRPTPTSGQAHAQCKQGSRCIGCVGSALALAWGRDGKAKSLNTEENNTTLDSKLAIRTWISIPTVTALDLRPACLLSLLTQSKTVQTVTFTPPLQSQNSKYHIKNKKDKSCLLFHSL